MRYVWQIAIMSRYSLIALFGILWILFFYVTFKKRNELSNFILKLFESQKEFLNLKNLFICQYLINQWCKISALVIKFLGIEKEKEILEIHRYIANISNVNDRQSGFAILQNLFVIMNISLPKNRSCEKGYLKTVILNVMLSALSV